MSDNNNKNENHRSVKDLFENFEVQPGQHVWDNIINSVHSINAAKIKRNKIIGTATAIAVAASAVAIIIILNSNYVQDTPTTTTNITTSSTTPLVNKKNTLNSIDTIDSTTISNNTAEIKNTPSELTLLEQQNTHTEDHNLPTTMANNTNTTANNTTIPITEMATINTDTHTSETNNNNTHNEEPKKAVPTRDTANTTANQTKPNNNADNNSITATDSNTAKPNTNTYANKTNNSNSDRDGVIYVPTAFTPDQTDNNRFFVKGKNIKDYEIRIMSKAKVLVYSSTDINEQWDGTHNGEALERGVYIYMIVFTDMNNKVHHKNGTITLIRQN
jgi:gliding motility-associated-like protein